MKSNKYFLAAFSAFFIWGFFTLALRQLQDYPSIDILFYRIFTCVFLMVIINLIFRRKTLIKNRIIFKNLIVNNYLFIRNLQNKVTFIENILIKCCILLKNL